MKPANGGEAIRLILPNPTNGALTYFWSLGQNNGTLAAKERTVIEIPMPMDAVEAVSIILDLGNVDESTLALPSLKIVR